MVIFVHANNNKQYNNSGFAYWCEYLVSENLCRMAVPLFFAISGFQFYKTYSWDRIRYKYKTRFFSLILPYFIWNSIWMIVFYFISKLPIINSAPFSMTWENIFYGIFLYRYCSVFWFMFQLIFFVLINPVIYIAIKNKNVGAILLVGLYIVYGFGISKVITVIRIDSLIYYLIGSYAAIHFKEFVYSSEKIKGIIGFIMIVISQILFAINYNLNFAIVDILILTIGMIGFFFVFCLIKDSKIKVTWFMQSTFILYAMHGLILETIKKFVFLVLPHTHIISILSYFSSLVITIFIIYVFIGVISKHLPKIYMLLSGGRKPPLLERQTDITNSTNKKGVIK